MKITSCDAILEFLPDIGAEEVLNITFHKSGDVEVHMTDNGTGRLSAVRIKRNQETDRWEQHRAYAEVGKAPHG